MTLIDIAIVAGAILLGGVSSQVVFSKLKFFDLEKAEEKRKEMLIKSKKEAEEIKEESEKNAERIKISTEDMCKQMKTLIHTIEQNVKFKEDTYAKKKNKNKQYQDFIKLVEEEAAQSGLKQHEREGLIKQRLAARLGETIKTLTDNLVADFKRDLREEALEKTKKIIETAQDKAEKTAKNIIRNALQKFADKTSVEKKEAKIVVKRDDAKALIVGKDAENILLFEEILGVDVIFNDEPNTIVVSSFDLLKKNVARIALEKLVKMRRINEKAIRDSIDEAKKILSQDLLNVGEKAVKKMRIKRKFPSDLLKIIGRLKYRTSYGQNILLHSFEVAYMAELLASELGLDVETAKIAAFFHDIGKAIDQHVEGSHDVLTREIMTKYKFSNEEIHAAWTHHEAATPETPEARIVMAADAISAGRPGARQESLERYLERLRDLEEIATSFQGVQKTYAISAGREIRVMVSPEEVPDEKMDGLADDIADKIEDKLSYPGKIKVNVIRRTRATDFAK
jgi:ribonuclease Y